jgi:hypothetical protein
MKKILVLGLSLIFFNIAMNAQCTSGDCINGKGTYVFKSGSKYVGTFKDGEIHGVGALYYSDGRRYNGQWLNRYQDGKGIMTYPDGTTIKGIWKGGEYYGEDGLAKADLPMIQNDVPDIQSGCIEGDCDNGYGKYFYADGTKYQGKFTNGKKNGFGACWFANGEFYMGNWKDNYFHGAGTKYLASGDSLAGNWAQGEYLRVPSKANENGCISGDCNFGSGSYVTSNGDRYFGAFKNGLFNGQGTCYYANGDKYVGEWKENVFHGAGTMYLANGTTANGTWENGAIKQTKDQLGDDLVKVDTKKPKVDDEMKVYAVVVGVANYNHMRTLNYTDDDAYRLAMFLRSPEGGALPQNQISILIDEDATKSKTLQTMHDVFARADENDMIMFYFSGHGLKGSFIPSDFDGFNNQISHEDVNKVMAKSAAKFKICIADACHSGSQEEFAAKSVESTSNAIASYYKAFDNISNSTILLLSSKAEEKSLESSGLRQGIFSHFLIRGLSGEADYDKDNIVQIDELYHFVNVNVQAYTGKKQSPIIKGTYDENMPMAIIKK